VVPLQLEKRTATEVEGIGAALHDATEDRAALPARLRATSSASQADAERSPASSRHSFRLPLAPRGGGELNRLNDGIDTAAMPE
jgi:hypothetical protein